MVQEKRNAIFMSQLSPADTLTRRKLTLQETPMPTDLDARLTEWRKALLDTTKRNRLIKFVAGRIGGVSLVRPAAADLWQRLVRDGEQLTFVWKREVLGLSEEVLNADS